MSGPLGRHFQGIELRITRLAPAPGIGYRGNLARLARSERGIDTLEESLVGRGRERRVRQRRGSEEWSASSFEPSGRKRRA
jgi:hypothetical protein